MVLQSQVAHENTDLHFSDESHLFVCNYYSRLFCHQKALVGLELFALTLVTVSCVVELAVSIRLLVVLANATSIGVSPCRRMCPRTWGWCFDKVVCQALLGNRL